MTAVKALKNEQPERALHVLNERLKQLARRMEARGEDSSEDEEDGVDSTEAHQTGVQNGLQDEPSGGQWWRTEADSERWSEAVGNVLTVACAPSSQSKEEVLWVDESDIAPLRESLLGKGYFVSPDSKETELPGLILTGMQNLRRSGVPTFYIWMYDEPWQVAGSGWYFVIEMEPTR
eukprot:755109-Hanusia_phi.AAC.8